MPAEYRIIVTDENDNELGEIVNWFDMVYSRRLNDYGSLSISFSSDDESMESLISLRRYSVKVYRDGSLVWAGEQVAHRGDLMARSDNKVVLTAYEYLEQLSHRFTDSYKRFDGVDAGSIAWTLIDDSQNLTNGDYGITQGSIETTKNRERTYGNKNILEAIQELSKVIDGFDFELTPEKVFNVYDQKGLDRTTTTVFEYGSNIEEISVDLDFINIINKAIVIGEDNRVERIDSALAGVYSLREKVVNAPNVTDDTTLNDKGDAINRKYAAPLLKLAFSQVEGSIPFFGSLSLGDIVKVRVARGIYNINNNFRLYGFEVSVSSDQKERIKYTGGLI